VLRQKGCEARTIHSLIYRPNGDSRDKEIDIIDAKLAVLYRNLGDRYPDKLTEAETTELKRLGEQRKLMMSDNKPRFTLWAESPLADPNCPGMVVDEVSMVDERMGKDIESFGKKILVLGDPAQLPPVGAGGYYTKREPDVMLTEVHRHAKDSGILRLATKVREGFTLPHLIHSEDWGPDVELTFRQDISIEDLWMWMLGADQVLLGKNETRHRLNHKYRDKINKYESGPMPDDRLVCLKNDHQIGIFNGSQWKVLGAECDFENKTADLKLESEDGIDGALHCSAWLHHLLGDATELTEMGPARSSFTEFDWSYALTVHKAQGSQWNDVVLLDESRSFRSSAKQWLYTGITRAAKKLKVVI
jgi:exodeoxyribonuclease-5